MAITSVNNSRVSDNRNSISWGYDNPQVSSVTLQRSTNGSGYASLASPSTSSTSYADTSTQINCYYSYRMQTLDYWTSGAMVGYITTDWVYSGTTYNSPAAPGKPSASRINTTTVRLVFTNDGRTQTATEIQRSSDGQNWLTVQTISGSKITQVDDAPGGGTWYYRVRNTRGSLVSAWSLVSDAVVTITPPAAPTLLGPTGVLKKTEEYVAFSWRHNPLDGSVQTQAEVRYSIDYATTWSYLYVGSVQNVQIDNNFAVNAIVYWQVRTRGAHADFGPWSSSGRFNVYQIPQPSIQLPTSPITEMPIKIKWDYSDESGYQIDAVAIWINENGGEEYRKTLSGSGDEIEITSSEFLPKNGKTYTLRIEVRSSSSLTGSSEIQLEMDYTEPFPPTGTVDINEGIAAVTLTVFASEEKDDDVPETVLVGIYREHADGRRVRLIDQSPSGAGFYDPYPPLDQDFKYVFISYAATGATAEYSIPAHIPSYGAVFFNYGDGFASVAMLLLDVRYDERLEHSFELYETAGNRRPLIFYGESEREDGAVSGTALKDPSMLDLPAESSIGALKDLSRNKDAAVFRQPNNDPILVNPTVRISSYHEGQLTNTFADITVDWTRVREDGVNGLAIR